MTTSVQQAVDSLGRAFQEFKSVNDQRLKKVEEKGACEMDLTQKLHALDSLVEKAQSRLQQLEMCSQRPAIGSDGLSLKSSRGFMDYVRKGMELGLSLETKSLSASSGPVGGYLVPQELGNDIYGKLSNLSPLRNLARVSTISSDALDMVVTKSEADAGWAQEVTERGETKAPELAKIRIVAHELYSRIRASQKLLDDSAINVEEWLSHQIATKMAAKENDAFLNGNGEGKPFGLLNAETTVAGKHEYGKVEEFKTGKNGDLQNADLLIDIFSALKPQYLMGAVWMMPRSALSIIRKLKDKTTGQYLWQPGLTAGSQSSLLGHPIVICDDMPTVTVDTPSRSIVFGNIAEAYHIVDRKQLSLLRDPYSHKPFVEFYATKRVGGMVINAEAMKFLTFAGE